MNQALIGDRARAIGLRTLKRAAGAVTRLVPISTPVLLVGPDSAARLGRAVADFGHRRVLLVTDAVVMELGLTASLADALAAAGVQVTVFAAVTADAPIAVIEQGLALFHLVVEVDIELPDRPRNLRPDADQDDRIERAVGRHRLCHLALLDRRELEALERRRSEEHTS